MAAKSKTSGVSVSRGLPESDNSEKLSGPAVTVFARPDNATTIPLSSLNLILGTGRLSGNKEILMPYLEFRLLKEPDGEDETEEALRVSIAFENAAFLLMDMAGDFCKAAQQLKRVSKGDLPIEPRRMRYGVKCLTEAVRHINESLIELEQIPGVTQVRSLPNSKRLPVKRKTAG